MERRCPVLHDRRAALLKAEARHINAQAFNSPIEAFVEGIFSISHHHLVKLVGIFQTFLNRLGEGVFQGNLAHFSINSILQQLILRIQSHIGSFQKRTVLLKGMNNFKSKEVSLFRHFFKRVGESRNILFF
jgi:hypothetical protein